MLPAAAAFPSPLPTPLLSHCLPPPGSFPSLIPLGGGWPSPAPHRLAQAQALSGQAKRAELYREEVQALRERAGRLPRLQEELRRCRERLQAAEACKSQLEVRREVGTAGDRVGQEREPIGPGLEEGGLGLPRWEKWVRWCLEQSLLEDGTEGGERWGRQGGVGPGGESVGEELSGVSPWQRILEGCLLGRRFWERRSGAYEKGAGPTRRRRGQVLGKWSLDSLERERQMEGRGGAWDARSTTTGCLCSPTRRNGRSRELWKPPRRSWRSSWRWLKSAVPGCTRPSVRTCCCGPVWARPMR